MEANGEKKGRPETRRREGAASDVHALDPEWLACSFRDRGSKVQIWTLRTLRSYKSHLQANHVLPHRRLSFHISFSSFGVQPCTSIVSFDLTQERQKHHTQSHCTTEKQSLLLLFLSPRPGPPGPHSEHPAQPTP